MAPAASVNPQAYLASGGSLIIDQKARPGLVSGTMMSEFRDYLGLGPRACACGTVFTPPPYLCCKDMVKCEQCASEELIKWARTPEGIKAIEDARAKINQVTHAKTIPSKSPRRLH